MCAILWLYSWCDYLIYNIYIHTWVQTRPFSWRKDSPRSRDKTDLSPTGSDIKLTTRSDTTPREDTGEEPNSKFIDHLFNIHHTLITINRNTPQFIHFVTQIHYFTCLMSMGKMHGCSLDLTSISILEIKS